MTTATRVRTLDVAVDAITPNPDQPRKLFDQAALDELAASIAEHGLMQPIVVRLDGDRTIGDQPRYVIVAGERRWRAARIAQLAEIPVRVVDGIDTATAFTLSVVENVNRRDMTDMEEARGYATLRDFGRTVDQIAGATGKTVRWVQMYLDLIDLRPEIAQLLDAGGIKIGVAWSFSRISPAGQQLALRKYLAGEFKSDRDAQAYASAVRGNEGQGALFAEPLTPSQRAQHLRDRRDLLSKLAKLAHAWEACNEIAKLDPAEVAAALAGDGGAATYRDQLSMVVGEANRALGVLRRATAADAAARSLPAE